MLFKRSRNVHTFKKALEKFLEGVLTFSHMTVLILILCLIVLFLMIIPIKFSVLPFPNRALLQTKANDGKKYRSR